MKSICVFTPTYNRAHTLPDLYSSLKRQSNRDFKWLIIDDGSTDNTEEIVSSFQAEEEIEIELYRVSNGGKQRAFDRAVEISNEELFFNVDSDDYLVDDAIKIVLEKWKSADNKGSIAGMIGLKGHNAGIPLHTEMPSGLSLSTLKGLYKKGFKGDTSLIYRTDVLRQYPFNVDVDEKFIPESYVYNQIDQEYQCMLINKVLTVVRYMPDGYTNAFPANVIANPKGYYREKKQCMELADGWRDKLRSTVLFLVACRMSNMNRGIKACTNKVIGLICYLPAAILYWAYFRK